MYYRYFSNLALATLLISTSLAKSKDAPHNYLYSSDSQVNKNSTYHNLPNSGEILGGNYLIVGWNHKYPSATIGNIPYPSKKNNFKVQYEIVRHSGEGKQNLEFEIVATIEMRTSKDLLGNPSFPIVEATINPKAKGISASFLKKEPIYKTNKEKTHWDFQGLKLKNIDKVNNKNKVDSSGSFGAIKIESNLDKKGNNTLYLRKL